MPRKKSLLNIFLLFILFRLLIFIYTFKEEIVENNIQYQQDNLTIVSAYYKIKSKRKPRQYKDFLHNFIMLNKSIVFFTNKRFMSRLKKMRPKEY